MDQAIAGIKTVIPEVEIEKIHLIYRRIKYRKWCLTCRNDDPGKAIADYMINETCRRYAINLTKPTDISS